MKKIVILYNYIENRDRCALTTSSFGGRGVEAMFPGCSCKSGFGSVILSRTTSMTRRTRSLWYCRFLCSFIGLATHILDCFGNTTLKRRSPLLLTACWRKAPALWSNAASWHRASIPPSEKCILLVQYFLSKAWYTSTLPVCENLVRWASSFMRRGLYTISWRAFRAGLSCFSHIFFRLCWSSNSACAHLRNDSPSSHSWMFCIWNIMLVHFSVSRRRSWLHVAQDHQKWLHIDRIQGFSSPHPFDFAAATSSFFRDFAVCHTSNSHCISFRSS